MKINKTGVYLIQNIKTSHCYIGQSSYLNLREQQHFSRLERNTHFNRHLQQSFNKYKRENFIFTVLLYCEQSELTYYEQGLVDGLNPIYNLRRECVDSNKGIKFSEDVRQKLSNNSPNRVGTNNPFYGKSHTSESKIRMSEAQTKRFLDPKEREKLSVYTGRHPTKDTREKMSKGRIGIERSIDTRTKISNTLVGTKPEGPWTSNYVGVGFDSRARKWRARINSMGKRINLGSFTSEILAAQAYNKMALNLYGSEAKLNEV